MATLQDIADVVGVSTVTVSKVLRGKVKGSWPRSAAQAKRIREVAEQMGYRVDWRARALKTKRTHMIGILSTDKPETRTHDQNMLDGLVETLGEAGYHLVFVRVAKGSRGRDFTDARFDGLIIDYHIEPEELEIVRQSQLPAVIINAPSREQIVSVMPDHRKAGAIAARHLLALGHRRFGFIHSSTGEQARWPVHMVEYWREGIVQTLKEAGLADALIDIMPECSAADESPEAYYNIYKDILATDDRPTALIANHPCRAVESTLHHLGSLGLNCPKDISILAMGDEMGLTWCRPMMTAVRMPFGDMGREAARQLLAQIEKGDNTHELEPRPMKPELVVRESTGPAPEQVKIAKPLRK